MSDRSGTLVGVSERTTDAQLPGVVAERSAGWESTARMILEFGEEGLVEGVVSEQAVAVLLLAREVRRLRVGEDDFQFLRIDTDLNMEDDEGHNWTILPLARVMQDRIAPGLRCTIGRSGSLANAVILKLELLDQSAAWEDIRVVVTFRQPTHSEEPTHRAVAVERDGRLVVVTGVPNNVSDPTQAVAAAVRLNTMLTKMLASGNDVSIRGWDDH